MAQTVLHWIDLAWSYVSPVAVALYYGLVLFAVVKILLENKNPLKTHSYLLLLILVPVVGLLVYIIFGQDYRRSKMFSRKKALDKARIERYVEEQLELAQQHELIEDRQVQEKIKIIRLLLNNNQAFLTKNNRVDVLVNGEAKFPALIEAIRHARHHIHIEYYIFDNDVIGNRLADLLVEKAKQGIEVRFIYDDVGTSHIANKFKTAFKNAGIRSAPFMPVYLPKLSRANYRDHRKIVVVDGVIGFTGGINVADRYINPEHVQHWRDTHLKIDGDAVYALQIVFLLNWYFVSHESIPFSPSYFPDFTAQGHVCVQIAASGPDSDWATIMQAIFMAISTAKDQILITTPYFIPNEAILTALKTAAMGGVDVQIIFPNHSDSVIVHSASMSYMKELLQSGVKVMLYSNGFIHSKTIIVDKVMASVGTANMDYRSFDQNFEVNAFIYDTAFAEKMIGIFENDKEHCVPLQLSRWQQRPLRKRIVESAARLLAPLL